MHSFDSLEDSHSEVDTLREELKKNLNTIEEKNKIISSLRLQVDDLREANDELEKSQQLLQQKFDQIQKQFTERNEETEAISHALGEVEKANELLTKRLAGRTEQLQKFVDELKSTKKELNESRSREEELRNKNELLNIELTKTSRKRHLQENDGEELVQELYDLRAQVKSLSHRQSRRSIDEEIMKLKQELEVTETSLKAENYHKERYARENFQLERKVNELIKDLNNMKESYLHLQCKLNEVERNSSPPPPLPPKSTRVQDENKPEPADETGEFMDVSSKLSALVANTRVQHQDFRPNRAADCVPNYRIQKSRFFDSDPIAEQKLRLARASELARRNMQTKPLHQTSYPLELDTFDTTNLTENDIKSGGVHRQALSDFSNQRKPSKKPEAFIV